MGFEPRLHDFRGRQIHSSRNNFLFLRFNVCFVGSLYFLDIKTDFIIGADWTWGCSGSWRQLFFQKKPKQVVALGQWPRPFGYSISTILGILYYKKTECVPPPPPPLRLEVLHVWPERRRKVPDARAALRRQQVPRHVWIGRCELHRRKLLPFHVPFRT